MAHTKTINFKVGPPITQRNYPIIHLVLTQNIRILLLDCLFASLCKWVVNVLTNRSQPVKSHNISFSYIYLNIGFPPRMHFEPFTLHIAGLGVLGEASERIEAWWPWYISSHLVL